MCPVSCPRVGHVPNVKTRQEFATLLRAFVDRVTATAAQEALSAVSIRPRDSWINDEKEPEMGRLDGKVALISGGARGQGAAEAQLFAREGAKVVFGDILDAQGRQVEADIRAAGGEVTYVHLDVTNEASWRAAVGTAVSR